MTVIQTVVQSASLTRGGPLMLFFAQALFNAMFSCTLLYYIYGIYVVLMSFTCNIKYFFSSQILYITRVFGRVH